MARYMRSDLGRGHTLLRPPVVVSAAVGPTPIAPRNRVRLFLISTPQVRIRQTEVRSFLRPPVVLAAARVFTGPQTNLAPLIGAPDPHRRLTSHFLRPPVVVADIVLAGPVP